MGTDWIWTLGFSTTLPYSGEASDAVPHWEPVPNTIAILPPPRPGHYLGEIYDIDNVFQGSSPFLIASRVRYDSTDHNTELEYRVEWTRQNRLRDLQSAPSYSPDPEVITSSRIPGNPFQALQWAADNINNPQPYPGGGWGALTDSAKTFNSTLQYNKAGAEISNKAQNAMAENTIPRSVWTQPPPSTSSSGPSSNNPQSSSQPGGQSSQDRKLYRGMTEGPDGKPLTGESARKLGVRPGDDIDINNGRVQPGTGGMSVSPDDPYGLPLHRRPPAFGGTGKDPVWSINESQLPDALKFLQDKPTHGVIEPSREMSYDEYSKALYDLKDLWKKAQP